MGRYDNQNKQQGISMWKIMLGVAFGLALSASIAIAERVIVFDTIMKGYGDMMHKITANSKAAPVEVTPSGDINIITKGEVIRRNSESALTQARNETKNFDKQYKKPDECFNMKDRATRVFCANAYMRARAEFNNARN